jgi:hypothetical protein
VGPRNDRPGELDLIAPVYLCRLAAVIVRPLPEREDGINEQGAHAHKTMRAVTPITSVESPTMAAAGVDAGAQMVVGLILLFREPTGKLQARLDRRLASAFHLHPHQPMRRNAQTCAREYAAGARSRVKRHKDAGTHVAMRVLHGEEPTPWVT